MLGISLLPSISLSYSRLLLLSPLPWLSPSSRSTSPPGPTSTVSSPTPVRPGAAGLLTGAEYSRVENSTWQCPTSFVPTRIGVELVDGSGN